MRAVCTPGSLFYSRSTYVDLSSYNCPLNTSQTTPLPNIYGATYYVREPLFQGYTNILFAYELPFDTKSKHYKSLSKSNADWGEKP